MRDGQTSVSAGLNGVALPLVTALVGVAAALMERGIITLVLLAVLLALCGLALRNGFRSRAQVAEAAQLAAEHRMLRESIEHNPMPYAVYDDQDNLLAWNKSYEAVHAEAFRRLQPKLAHGRVKYSELVRMTAEVTLPPDAVEAYVAERVRRQREADGIGVDREYPGLGWRRVCKFVTPSGAVAGFAIDINELKQRETALKAQISLSDMLARQLRELADTDALTGTQSRLAFLEHAHAELQRSRRYGHPMCVAMLDIDAFKAVNDTHGHATGDQVLAQVAGVCLKQLRAGIDICGRLGGEEFAIFLPETELGGAQVFAERLRREIHDLRFEAAGRNFGVTASIGVAALCEADDSMTNLLGRADAALYKAKSGGRDRVVLAST